MQQRNIQSKDLVPVLVLTPYEHIVYIPKHHLVAPGQPFPPPPPPRSLAPLPEALKRLRPLDPLPSLPPMQPHL